MNEDVIIRAEGLGKKYLIGHQSNERYLALRDVLARTAGNLTRSARNLLSGKPLIDGDTLEDFWALRDLSFEIRRGDVVGIIGRNGAGKSTLLKVLSRITEPSVGRVTIKGRVASLLEVGTGFHPELSGRENVYLNGAILGMTREEIRRRFDEIVEFSGVEKFLDTPVKRYSSGMYVRLAFAVAAHMEPEILVVDEVLAVGDAEFQNRCLGKMRDVASHGRTVLFVSHNIGSIQRLCNSGMLLTSGRLSTFGAISRVLEDYRSAGADQNSQLVIETSRFTSVTVVSYSEEETRLNCETTITALDDCEIAIHVHIKDANGIYVVIGSASGYGIKGVDCRSGSTTTIVTSMSLTGLASGQYSIAAQVFDERSAIGGVSKDEYSFVFEGAPIEGATYSLKQAWGLGSLQVRMDQGCRSNRKILTRA